MSKKAKSKSNPFDILTEGVTDAQLKFLEIYVQTGNILQASEIAGWCRMSHYGAMARSESYRQAFAVAKRKSIEAVEDKLRELALVGAEKPITFRGKVIATYREPSERALLRILEADDRERWRPSQEVVNNNGPDVIHLEIGSNGRSLTGPTEG
jgi:hypothetical protein